MKNVNLKEEKRPITTENDDLEHGDVDMIEKAVLSLLDDVKGNHLHGYNRFPSPFYMIHKNFRENIFIPHVVHIGPVCGRKRPELLVYDGHKASYLISLLNRIPFRGQEILNSCMEKVYDSVDQICACYARPVAQLSDTDRRNMAKMMVMDSCFILEFINKISEYHVESYRGNMLPDQTIIYDLVLLENQIPFFLLDKIFQCTILKFKPNTSLIEFILPLLNLLNIFKENIKIENISVNSTHHILSLLHECYKPQHHVTSSFLTAGVHSATNLDMAGVNFKPNHNKIWLMGMDVKLNRMSCFSLFGGKLTLQMPVLHVHDFTELVLSNLIAYEHQLGEAHKYVTSYAYAMDMLVNTQEDVAKLADSSVLINYMGSNEEAANMINSICKQVARVHFFYGEEWEKLTKYCNSYWPKNIAWLRRTYFNSPWNIIALFAGVILFALTVVQTIFTVKSAKSN